MSSAEQRNSERLLLTIPVRVMGFDPRTGTFTEDTHTVMVNRAGALIRLRHRVAADDSIRIVNLENYAEADFRVVGLARTEAREVYQWGVECLELERNIWGASIFLHPWSHRGRGRALCFSVRVAASRA
jgi:hypothetical protein